MQTPEPRSVEQWRDWFRRVSDTIRMLPPLHTSMIAEFTANADDDDALRELQRRIEAIVYELDQDAVSADLLAHVLLNPSEKMATQRVSATLDRLSGSLLRLLLKVKDRRFVLGTFQ